MLVLTSVFLTWFNYIDYCQQLSIFWHFYYYNSLLLRLSIILCYIILLITVIAVFLELFFTLFTLKLFSTSILWISSHCIKIYWLKTIVFVIFWDLLLLLLLLSSDYYSCFDIIFFQSSFIHLLINLDYCSNHILKCHRSLFSCYVIFNYILQISIELFSKNSIILT